MSREPKSDRQAADLITPVPQSARPDYEQILEDLIARERRQTRTIVAIVGVLLFVAIVAAVSKLW